QQPVRGRSFGFGEKDRRVIDPPPIIQLFYDSDNTLIKSSESVLFIVHCDLYSIDKTTNKNVVYIPSTMVPTLRNEHEGINIISLKEPTKVRNLIGSLTSNAYHLFNEHNEMGIYFIFHDLTVRTEGTFVLKFMFMDLASGEPFTMTTNVQSEIFSEPFTIYSAKKFPGLLESTPLSRAFAKQGVKISIRNDSRG
ncbi:velvet factor, partial [Cunninghamella echinulata]